MLLALLLLSAPPVVADRDVPYVVNGHPRQVLDVYSTLEEDAAPVLVVVHGGGWKGGSKRSAEDNARAILANRPAVVIVSVEYRLVPEVGWDEQAADVAAALAWVHANVAEYGGDPAAVSASGHSAGAHLAALVATDPTYLAKHGLTPDFLRAVVLLDGAAYDVPTQYEASRGKLIRARMYRDAFGDDPARQRAASPTAHAGEGPLPPFLIAHVQRREASAEQAASLAEAVREAGGRAERVSVPGSHMTIYNQFGKEGDPVLAEAERLYGVLSPRVK